jgi:hypothetical protein
VVATTAECGLADEESRGVGGMSIALEYFPMTRSSATNFLVLTLTGLVSHSHMAQQLNPNRRPSIAVL